MTKLDVIKKCEFLYDGQITIDRTKELIEDAISYGSKDIKRLRPVSMILLDF